MTFAKVLVFAGFAAGLAGTCLGQVPHAVGADREILAAQAVIRKAPSSPRGYDRFAMACLQKARETGDVSWLTHADRLLQKAGQLAPKDVETLQGFAAVRLQQHRFADAISLTRRVLLAQPDNETAYGVIGDSLIELGDYDAAFDAYQTMADLKPGIAAYTRAAYARVLQGDVDGARKMLRMAANGGATFAENVAWALVQMGNESLSVGDLDGAEHAYREALGGFPNYVHGIAGLAKVAAARGNAKEAIRLFERATAAIPLHDYVVALGDLYAATGRKADAERQFALVAAVAKMNRAAGITPGVELAQFYCDHNRNLPEALTIARKVEQRQKDIRTEDALAWALYRNNRYAEALEASKRALRLGTRDATFMYHRGRIEQALGHRDEAARYLNLALQTNPYFNARDAAATKSQLARLAPERTIP